jgi:uncharacterized membrane protein
MNIGWIIIISLFGWILYYVVLDDGKEFWRRFLAGLIAYAMGFGIACLTYHE